MKSEIELIQLAQEHPNDSVANKEMKELRERFDKTYGWCEDCDGLVCKEKDCCMNLTFEQNKLKCVNTTNFKENY